MACPINQIQEPPSSMCIECGKTNGTKGEVDKHIMFHTRENELSYE
jgi:hypothetical protein